VTFVKGQKPPNPGGLTPRKVAMMRRLEGLTIKAVDVLEEILTSTDASRGEKLAAAREVFDRAVGKPKQQASLEVTHNASPHLTALVGMAAMTAMRVQSAPEIDGQVIEIIEPVTIVDQSEHVNVDVDAGQSDAD
jgi:hypothetical protein